MQFYKKIKVFYLQFRLKEEVKKENKVRTKLELMKVRNWIYLVGQLKNSIFVFNFFLACLLRICLEFLQK